MKHGSKRKNIWVIMGLVLVIVVCLGFGGYKLFYGNHTSSDKSETTVHQQKKSWNKTKDKRLNQFMNQWNSDYEQATYSKKIKFYHNTIPNNLKDTNLTVNDKKVSVEWSTKGTGTKDYQIVATYTDAPTNDDDPNLYLFTMHNGTPVVLETDDDSEMLDFEKSNNDDLVDNFKNVVDGERTETVKSSSSSSEQSSGNSSDKANQSVSSDDENLIDSDGNEKVASPENIRGTWYAYSEYTNSIDKVSISKYSMTYNNGSEDKTISFYRNSDEESYKIEHNDWGRVIVVTTPVNGITFFDIRGWQQQSGDGTSYGYHSENGQDSIISAYGAGFWTRQVWFKTEGLAQQYKDKKYDDLIYND